MSDDTNCKTCLALYGTGSTTVSTAVANTASSACGKFQFINEKYLLGQDLFSTSLITVDFNVHFYSSFSDIEGKIYNLYLFIFGQQIFNLV